jgi:GH25 family lysozyme M1 (1,4-beta-N-acetylmuramidase)
VSTPEQRVPFRAGRAPGEEVAPMHDWVARSLAASRTVRAADISEFQPNIADAAYVRSFSQAIIIRAAYGMHHDDKAWFGGDRRKQLHDHGVRYLGIYQYIVAGQDITQQAKAFCRLVKAMRPGEDLWADIEEGAGSQQNRWVAWANVVHGELGWSPGTYSGRFFARDHGLQPVKWVASYSASEPPETHMWWQFTDALTIPGIGKSDCSVFHGTMDDLAARAYGAKKPQKDWTQEAIMALPVLKEGAKDLPGQTRIVHRLQNEVAGVGRWNKLPAAAAVKDDGSFGPATTAGVKAVQAFFDLHQTGIADRDTWTKLIGV